MESTLKIGAIALVSLLTFIAAINSSASFALKMFQCKSSQHSTIANTNYSVNSICYPRIYTIASDRHK